MFPGMDGSDGEWKSDSSLTVDSVTVDHILTCTDVEIVARGEAARRQTSRLCRYKPTRLYSAGRPVYRHSHEHQYYSFLLHGHNQYLFVHPSSSNWIVGDHMGTYQGWIQSRAAPGLSPTSVDEKKFKKKFKKKREGGWEEGNIHASCHLITNTYGGTMRNQGNLVLFGFLFFYNTS